MPSGMPQEERQESGKFRIRLQGDGADYGGDGSWDTADEQMHLDLSHQDIDRQNSRLLAIHRFLPSNDTEGLRQG